MNIMNKLTLKHVKQNRRRTILTIIGIILSVSMFTAVSTGMDSCLKWMENITLEENGTWQIQYKKVPADKINILKSDEEIGVLSLINEKGYAVIDGMEANLKEKAKSQGKHYLNLSYYDESACDNMPIRLESGRFPKNAKEIVVPNHMLEGLTKPYKIGDTITLDFGERKLITDSSNEDLMDLGMEKEKPLGQMVRYLGEKTSMINSNGKTIEVGEKFIPTGEKKQYTIVGVIEKPSFITEFFNSPGYTVLAGLDNSVLTADARVNAYVYMKDADMGLYDQIVTTAKKLGIADASVESAGEIDNVDINNGVLYYSGVMPSDNFNNFNKLVSAILNIIIIIGSVSLIYNSFAISISQRSKQLGMLSSVGATKRQKRNSVLFEAGIYALIGIPLGILAGILGLTVTFKLINPLFTGMINTQVELSMYITARSVVVPIILAIVTILISTYVPAKHASKVAPIEAIRQSKDIKVTAKSIKTSRLTKKIFGLEGEIALKNMKRNKRHYRSLIFSLFISVVLFISVAAYIHYMTAAFGMAKNESNFDVRVSSNAVKNTEFAEIVEDLRTHDSVDQAAVAYNLNGYKFMGAKKIVAKNYADYVQKEHHFEYVPEFQIVALDDTTFTTYCKAVGVDSKEYKDASHPKGILLNYYSIRGSYKVQDFEPLIVKAGDTLSLQTEYELDVQPEKLTIQVGTVTKKLPLGIDGYGTYTEAPIPIIIPDSMLKTVVAKAGITLSESGSTMYLTAKDEAKIGEDISQVMRGYDYAEHDYNSYNIFEMEKTTRQLLLAISVFAYGFIILMSLICCANMCNTISTSIMLRRKEFSMLRSIGMTPKVFRRMIMYESLLYGVKALLYGLPVGILLSYFIYRAVVDTFSVGFALPLSIYAVVIVLVFGVVGLAMFYSSRKVRKETIIDGLKEEIL